MKKLYYLIVLALILGLVLTGCTLLSNISQVPATEQSGISYLTKGGTLVDPDVFTLYAGQHIDVGTVSVWNGINEALGVECLYVKYETTGGWVMTETHLEVAPVQRESGGGIPDPIPVPSRDEIPQTRRGNPIPGQFTHKHEDLDFEQDDEYIIPLSEIGDGEVGCGDTFYIAAQASLQNLNNPDELVGTVTVKADSSSAACSDFDLESGKMYQLEASETAFAGDTIWFDAKYSNSTNYSFPSDSWTDEVAGYMGDPNLLGLAVDGEFVGWGDYNEDHVYYWDMDGSGSCVSLWIYDLPGSYGNNTGSLTVNIYLYQEESAWAGIANGEETQIPFPGKNWATYFTYDIENLLPTISSEDLAGPFTAGEPELFTVTTVNPECGFEYSAVLFNFTISDIDLSYIASFEAFWGEAWHNELLTMSQVGSDVIGYFGPQTGFPMGVNYDEITDFKITFDTAGIGIYNVVIILNDLANSNAVLATLTEDVVVNP